MYIINILFWKNNKHLKIYIPGKKINGLLTVVPKLLVQDWCMLIKGNRPVFDWTVCCWTTVGVAGINAAPAAPKK